MDVEKTHYRTLFLSDWHLGLSGIKSAELLAFLETHEAETIYLVGDIIDQWVLGRKWAWNEDCDNILRNLLQKTERGTKIVYIPGNHDDSFRSWANASINGISIQRQAVHITADGRRLWVIHGDEFDLFMRNTKFLCHLGHLGCQLLMKFNRPVAWFRRRLKLKPWSLAAAARRALQNSSKTYRQFSKTVTEEARRLGYDGVVCGHIHRAEFKLVDGIEYWNDGDWVESCTATSEAMDGTMATIHYAPPNTTIEWLRQRASVRYEGQESLDIPTITPALFSGALQ